MNGTLYGLCISASLFVSWRAFIWLAERLEFSTKWGAIIGRTLSSAIVGLLLGFALSGLISEILISRNPVLASSMSSFAAAFFGGIFTFAWGVIWGLFRGVRESVKMQSVAERSVMMFTVELRWLVPTAILGLAIYFLGLGFQSQPENIFGQYCQRAISTTERIGGTCFRSEWEAVGVILAIISGIFALKVKASGSAMSLNERNPEK